MLEANGLVQQGWENAVLNATQLKNVAQMLNMRSILQHMQVSMGFSWSKKQQQHLWCSLWYKQEFHQTNNESRHGENFIR